MSDGDSVESPPKAEPAPLHEEIAYGPPGGAGHRVRAADGVGIRVGFWRSGLRGTVLILPGRGEYAEKYGRAAARLAAREYSVAVIDWRGHGLSDRVGGHPTATHVQAFRDYLWDVKAVVDFLDSSAAPRPLHLLAHSMGGTVGLRALIEGLDAASVVFVSPLWGYNLSGAALTAARIVTGVVRVFGALETPVLKGARSRAESVAFRKNVVTSHEPMFRWLRDQTHTHPELGRTAPTARWVSEALAECRALESLPSPDTPCLAIIGSEETVVRPEAVRDRVNRWSGGRLHVIPGCRHEPLMEAPAIRERAFEETVRHFDRNG